MKNVFVSENASPELVRYLKYKKKDIVDTISAVYILEKYINMKK